MNTRYFSLLLFLGFSLLGCSSLEFRNESVIGVEEDTATRSKRVTLSYEVWHEGEATSDIDLNSFRVIEDGIAATSESLATAGTEVIRTPVIVLLDLSFSMYQANAVVPLKAAASKFVADLRAQGFPVTIQRFASDVQYVTDIGDIPPGQESAAADQRWTSLYYAVGQALTRPGVIVLFSDGADNYSQNKGVKDVWELNKLITSTRRLIHVIGFGNVRHEQDRTGVNALKALRLIGRFGSFTFAEDAQGFAGVFDDIAKRLRNIYILNYFTPNLSGKHRLQIEVKARGSEARSRTLWYDASRAGAPGDAFSQLMENMGQGGSVKAARAKLSKLLAKQVKAPGHIGFHSEPEVGQWAEYEAGTSQIPTLIRVSIVGKRGSRFLVELESKFPKMPGMSSTMGMVVKPDGKVTSACIVAGVSENPKERSYSIKIGDEAATKYEGDYETGVFTAAGRDWDCKKYTDENPPGTQRVIWVSDDAYFRKVKIESDGQTGWLLVRMGTGAKPSMRIR